MYSDRDDDSDCEPDFGPEPDPNIVDDPETWMDYWSEELVTLWHSLQDRCAAGGWAILDRAAFPDFTDFCWRLSSGRKPAA